MDDDSNKGNKPERTGTTQIKDNKSSSSRVYHGQKPAQKRDKKAKLYLQKDQRSRKLYKLAGDDDKGNKQERTGGKHNPKPETQSVKTLLATRANFRCLFIPLV